MGINWAGFPLDIRVEREEGSGDLIIAVVKAVDGPRGWIVDGTPAPRRIPADLPAEEQQRLAAKAFTDLLADDARGRDGG